MKESKFYWTFTKIRLFDCWGMLQILKWEAIELLFLLHYLPTQMNVFFFSFLGKQTRGLGFYAMRKCNITFFYFLLHVILPCFLYVTHRRKIKIQTLSLSLWVAQRRETYWLWTYSVKMAGVGVCFVILLNCGWGYHCWMGCRIGPGLYDIWAQRPNYTNFFLKVLIV